MFYICSKQNNMIDLLKIIAAKKLDKRAVAETLFPNADHPLPALHRITRGDGELSAEQYRVLSDLTNIPIGFLMSEDWRLTSESPNEIKFLRGEIQAVLNTVDYISVVSVLKDGAFVPVFELATANLPLKVYLQDLVNFVISNNVKSLKSIK